MQTTSYLPLPTCPMQQPGETLPEYAARILHHLLMTSCTATLTDEQLAQAETAACRAASQVQGRDAAAARTVAVLSAARHTIALVQRHRAAVARDDQAAALPQRAGRGPGGWQEPATLQPAPRRPTPPSSYSRPVPVGTGIRF